jgi:uncharacterized Rmd1/YagE family protein
MKSKVSAASSSIASYHIAMTAQKLQDMSALSKEQSKINKTRREHPVQRKEKNGKAETQFITRLCRFCMHYSLNNQINHLMRKKALKMQDSDI